MIWTRSRKEGKKVGLTDYLATYATSDHED